MHIITKFLLEITIAYKSKLPIQSEGSLDLTGLWTLNRAKLRFFVKIKLIQIYYYVLGTMYIFILFTKVMKI